MEGDRIRKEHVSRRLLLRKEDLLECKPPRSELECDLLESGVTLTEIMDDTERRVIAAALKKIDGNKALAARILGITRPNLYKKLIKHKLLQD